MDKKIERFLELSFKFSVSKDEMFPEYSLPTYATCYDYSRFKDVTTPRENQQEQTPEKTIAEKIMAEARNKAELAEEFEEYIKLQKELQDYYQALNKLNN